MRYKITGGKTRNPIRWCQIQVFVLLDAQGTYWGSYEEHMRAQGRADELNRLEPHHLRRTPFTVHKVSRWVKLPKANEVD